MASPLLPHQLPRKIKSVWAVRDLLGYGLPIFFLLLAIYFFPKIGIPSDDPATWIMTIAWGTLAFFALLLVINLALIPLRYHYTRYDLRETEVVFQHNVFFRRTTYVPIIRVQHVKVEQGPLLRATGLSSVIIHTAATSHSFAGLDVETARTLRDQILALVKEHQDGL